MFGLGASRYFPDCATFAQEISDADCTSRRRVVQNIQVQLQDRAQDFGNTGLLSVSCHLAERCVLVSVAPMRPAITACNPSHCVVHCKASPITRPLKRHKFLNYQKTDPRPQFQRLYAAPEDKESTEEDEVRLVYTFFFVTGTNTLVKAALLRMMGRMSRRMYLLCRILRVCYLRKTGR